ncbi:hypothetical protein ABZT49_27410 [Methylobacterium sp. EM32]|uniref:hypothetical protein n=1 Tax=Methylobacterium sp. EM32 TaxID=3163481 RepID=UPI0033A10C20
MTIGTLTRRRRLARAALARPVGSAALVASIGTVVAAIRPGVGHAALVTCIGTVVAAVRPGIGGRALPLVGTCGGAAILRRGRRTAGLLAALAARLLTIRAILPIGTVRPLLAVRAIGPIRTTLRPALLRFGPLPLLGFGPLAGRRRALARLRPLGTFALRLGAFLPGLGALAGLGSRRLPLLSRFGPLLPGLGAFLSRFGALARLRPLGRAPLRARAATRTAGAAMPTLAAGTPGTPGTSRSARTTGASRSTGPALSRPALGQPDHVVASRRRWAGKRVAGESVAGESLARQNRLEQQRRQDRAGQQQRAGRAHREEPLVRRRSLRTP